MVQKLGRGLFQKHIWLLLVFFIIGVSFRIWLLTLKDPVLRWDADWYYNAGVGVFEGVLPADCCFHGSGYPLFIGGVLFLTRALNSETIRIVQIFIDIVSGIVLGITAGRLFGKPTGYTVFGLYMVNPLTASYTTLLMTEVLTIFVISFMIYVVSHKKFLSEIRYFIAYGLLSGYLFLIKPGFLWFLPFSILGFSLFFVRGIGKKLRFILYSGSAIIPFFIVPLWFNFSVFQQKTITPPYTLSIPTMMYLTRYLPILPETLGEDLPMDMEWNNVITEYNYIISQKRYEEIPAFNARYKERLTHMNSQDRLILFQNYVRNIGSFWNKRNLFLHVDLLYPRDKPFVEGGNRIILLLSFLGIMYVVQKRLWTSPAIFLLLLLLLYGGTTFPLVSNLPRHSLPLYPAIFVFAGYGGVHFWHKIRNTVSEKRSLK